MDTELLKTRVKGRVKFTRFQGGFLYYQTEDDWEFPIPYSDTQNETGEAPAFLAVDKGIYFMRWIRIAMEKM